MSSLLYNMSPMLQQHHKIAPAKEQITSIDPPPPSPLLLLPVLEMLLAGKRRASGDTGSAAVCLT